MAQINSADLAQSLAKRWLRSLTKESSQEPVIVVECLQQGHDQLQFGRGFHASYLQLAGKKYQQGLGSHADCEILLSCEDNMQRLHAIVGVDQNVITQSVGGEKVRLVFSVEVDGEELWRSRELNVKNGVAKLDLTLPAGTKGLRLLAKTLDGNTHCAHANWAALRVTAAGKSRPVGAGIGSGPVPFPAPFSFNYGGNSSNELLRRWHRKVTPLKGRRGFSGYEITWNNPYDSLQCRLLLKFYSKYPAVEWIVYFKNVGKKDSKILREIQSLDLQWPVGYASDLGPSPLLSPATVWRSLGSPNSVRDFECIEESLYPGSRIAMAAGGGRSSNDWLPFFNLSSGDLGIITGIGWTGQWACSIELDQTRKLTLRAGIEKTHLRLHPGEEIRGPKILQLFWQGDRIDAHNKWRRLLMEHYIPRIEGQPIQGPFTIGHWGGMSTEDQLKRIAIYKKKRIQSEYHWVDAGWYGPNCIDFANEFSGEWAAHVGDWRVNRQAHPDGLKPISDAVRAIGMGFLLWVEPERARKGTFWANEFPQWFFDNTVGGSLLLNLGDEVARRGVTDFMIQLIRENQVKIYRQDFNFDPLPFWRKNDAEDRQGISEIRYVIGLYSFWDELREKFPGLIIDNCASGGRRIDLETISRSVPLWRSDIQCHVGSSLVAAQAQGMALSLWVPLHGSACSPTFKLNPTYDARSSMGPAWQFSPFPHNDSLLNSRYPWDWFQKMSTEYLRIRPSFAGDYYPLTDPKTDPAQWAVYQMDRPGNGEGFVMAFRREKSKASHANFRLRGLDVVAIYQIEDADTGNRQCVRGQELLETGIIIKIASPGTSSLIFYKIKKNE